jgi:tetratricopeptide (TPR) repeat protein
MTPVTTDEYRQLGYETSNDMIRHDTRRLLREYEEAALHIRQAGFGRARMGQMMFDAGEFTLAAEDWLAAAGCFYLVPDLLRLREGVEAVRQIDREGHIPPERRDIRAAILEREEQLRTLEEKLTQFDNEYRTLMLAHNGASTQEMLDFLVRQVRDLPGLLKLHAAIAFAAQDLKQLSLAAQHLEWAEKFGLGNIPLAVLRGNQLIAQGQHEQAIRLWRETLKVHRDQGYLRYRLAQTILADSARRTTSQDEAIEILRPLVENESADPGERLMGLSLSAILHLGLKHEAEYRRLLLVFDRVAEAVREPIATRIVAALRHHMPDVFPQPHRNGAESNSRGQPHGGEPDLSTLVSRHSQISKQHNPFTHSPAA